MANGGGRGWFQRRKPRPEPASAPAPEPEPTRIEAYEAQRGEARTTDFIPTAYTGSVASRRDFDDLVDPARNRNVDADPPASSVDDRRWAPPEERPEFSAGSTSTSATWTDRERNRPEIHDSAVADQTRATEVAGASRDDGTMSAVDPRSAAKYDWDAATAAALTDDGAAIGSPGGESLPRSEPDRLLEEIIREIVGDATAETVSSLQPPPRSAAARQTASAIQAESPAERTSTHVSGGDLPASDDELSARASEPRSDSTAERAADIPEAVESLAAPTPPVAGAAQDAPAGASPSSAPEQTNGDPDAPSAETVDVEYSSQGANGPVALSGPGEPAATGLPSGVGTADRSLQGSPSRERTTSPLDDVSRETRDADGGTPLADQIADETRRRLALEEAVLPLPPSTRVFTISNQKGGVGKTTSAVNLAAALARAGAHVLVIDLDPQGNASTALGVDHRSERQSVYEVLVSDLALSEVIQQSTEHERLDCVPATIHLAGAEIELVSLVAREQRLRRALDAHLATMERPYDYVFIDCPPSLGLLTINAFVAAREVLIPIQCEYYALEGLSQLLSNIELIEKHLNPELRLTTILLTMYDSRTNLAQQVAQEVRDHFPSQTLGTIIPRSVRVSEAPSYGQSVISYDFASSGSLSYREAAAEIARRGTSETKETH